MRKPFITAMSAMWKGSTALIAAAVMLLQFAGAQAGELQIAAANSDGNSVYDLSQSSSGLITGLSTLNSDGSKHGSFESLVWVPNAATGTLDLVVADPQRQQIVRYSGPKYGTSTTIYSWAGLGHGPAQPQGLSVDAAGDLFVVSSSCGFDGAPSLWVLPVNSKAASGYGAPVLIDHTFGGVKTLSLAETLVAGTTTSLWNAGDLLVLVGDSFDARVIVYAQQSIAQVIAYPSKPLTKPTSTPVPWSKFAPQWAVPIGFAEWPADATHGASLLITTVDGRILRFDTHTDNFDADFATGLGPGLAKIKTGLSASVPYAFVTQVQGGNHGQIFQFGAPPTNGWPNKPLASFSKGLSDPIGIAVTSSASTPASSCIAPNSCTFFGGALTIELSGPGAKNVSGNILEQLCEIPSDPRVTVHGTTWSCNGQTLDVSTFCPGFPRTLLPGTLCGHAGSTGAGLVVLKGTADGIDPVDNNTEILVQSNINAILPGPLNQNCPNPLAAFAWAPRPDLPGIEGTIVEDAMAPDFIDLTGFCDEPGVIQRGASMTSFGVGFNASGSSNGLPGYVNTAYTNLLSEVAAASGGITMGVESTLDADITNSKNAFDSGLTGAPNGYSCAEYWDVAANSETTGNPTAFSSTLTPNGGNPNIAYDVSGRLAHLYLLIQEASGGGANTAYPPATVPPCVTLTATPNPVAAGTAATLSWTALGVPAGSSCTLSGGAFNNKSEAASGSVSTGALTATTTYQLVCPGTHTGTGTPATGFDSITVTVTPATGVTVPNYVGSAVPASITGLTVGMVSYALSTYPIGEVTMQSPAANSVVASGTPVNFTVSGVKVPNYVNGLEPSSTTVTGAGLTLGTTATQASTVANGAVISQTPTAGIIVAGGTPVNFVVSNGPAASISSFSSPDQNTVVPTPTVPYASSVPLNWSATGDSCALSSADFSTISALPLTGSSYASPPLMQTGPQQITLTCTGGGVAPSQATQTITINVGPVPTITSFTASPTSYTTGSQAVLTWTTNGEPPGATCTLSATDGTYTTPTAVPVNGALGNGAVYTGTLTTAGTYIATLQCPNVATSATLNLSVSVPVPLNYPQGLAISPSNGNLYVTNSLVNIQGGQVLVYTPSPSGMIQQPALTIGPTISGSDTGLQNPDAVAFDSAGNLYVADYDAQQIFVISGASLATGTPTLLNSISTSYYNPVGVAVDGNGYVYVTCAGDSPGLLVFQSSTPSSPFAQVATWSGDANGYYSALNGVAVEGSNLLVATGSQVVSYALSDVQSTTANQNDSNGLPIGVTIPVPASTDTNAYLNGVNIAVDAASNIYVAAGYADYSTAVTSYPSAIATYSPIVYSAATGYSGGTLTNPSTTYPQAVQPVPNVTAPNPALAGPGGLTVDASGNLYVSNSPNNTVDVYTASSGAYQYDFLPIVTLNATQTGPGAYTLTWTSINVEPASASCTVVVSADEGGGTYSNQPQQNPQLSSGIVVSASYFGATLSCPGAFAQIYVGGG